MMKGLFILPLVMFMASFLMACSENDELESKQENNIVVINAGIGADEDSRTLLGDDVGTEVPIYWSDDTNEAFSVTIGEIPYTFTKKENTTNAVTAKFVCYDEIPTLTIGTYIAKYPVNNVSSYTQQEGTKESLHKYHYMEASYTTTEGQNWSDINFEFETKVAILKLTLNNDKFKEQNVTDVALNANETTVVAATSTFIGAADDGSIIVYFAVQPQTLNNVTITATCGGIDYTTALDNKTLVGGKMYRVIKEMTETVFVPQFSVSTTQKVQFSPGNLQYDVSTSNWCFAEEQYGRVGENNINFNSWIDLFGWGTSGHNNYEPYMYSTQKSYYYSESISNTKYDWGIKNSIKNGNINDKVGTWRTPTNAEWNYLFNIRENASSLFGMACISEVNGIIILPDNWELPAGIIFTSGVSVDSSSSYETVNNYTIEQWNILEAAGAIFLPTSGYRDSKSLVNMDIIGFYWSSTIHTQGQYGYCVVISASNINVNGACPIHRGLSVRLIKDL